MRGRWPDVLHALGVTLTDSALSGKHGPCPGCGGKDRFRFDNKGGNGSFFCSQGGGEPVAGDGFELLEHALGVTFPEALKRVAAAIGLEAPRHGSGSGSGLSQRPRNQDVIERQPEDSTAATRMQSVIDQAGPLEPDGEVARYLVGRGLQGVLNDLPQDLLEHPGLYYDDQSSYAAMVAVVRNGNGAVVNIHRTFLADRAKAPVDAPKKLSRPARPGGTAGGAIQLYRPSETLAIAEGIESALAVRQMTGLPTWAAISATLMSQMEIPPSVRVVEIWSDNDPAGLSAAGKLRDRLTGLGLTVRLRVPPGAGMDPLDWFKSRQSSATRTSSKIPDGSDVCQCPTCGEMFNSTKAFDQHRVGGFPSSRRCLTPDEMTDARMACRDGRWITRQRKPRELSPALAAMPPRNGCRNGPTTLRGAYPCVPLPTGAPSG